MTTLTPILIAGTIAVAATLSIAQAQTAHAGHGGHATSAAEQADDPVIRAYQEANARMHADMDIALTGDADIDFMRGMIPHH